MHHSQRLPVTTPSDDFWSLLASRRRTGTITAVDTAFAGASSALALAGLAATAAVTLGAASVIDADCRSTNRDNGKRRPQNQTVHCTISILMGTELRDAMPQHTAWANTTPPALTICRQEAASDSVPPDPEQDAGWPIGNDLSGREDQSHQLS